MSIIKRIISEEGFREKGYVCPQGKITWGYGFTSIDEPTARKQLGSKLRKEISWLCYCKNRLPYSYKRQPYNVREVLVDMTYNLGRNGMLNFKKMHQAIKDCDYELASKELLDSKYAKQLPARSKRNSVLLRNK